MTESDKTWPVLDYGTKNAGFSPTESNKWLMEAVVPERVMREKGPLWVMAMLYPKFVRGVQRAGARGDLVAAEQEYSVEYRGQRIGVVFE